MKRWLIALWLLFDNALVTKEAWEELTEDEGYDIFLITHRYSIVVETLVIKRI